MRFSAVLSKFDKSTISVGELLSGVAEHKTARHDGSLSSTAWTAIPQLFFSALLYTLWISSHIISEFLNCISKSSLYLMFPKLIFFTMSCSDISLRFMSIFEINILPTNSL